MRPSNDQQIRLRIRTSPSGTTITICGDLDIAAVPQLREQLLIALARAHGQVVFDLSEITFCDASGLASLVGARRRAELLGLHTSFAAPPPQVHKLLHITGLHRILVINPTAQAAVRPAHVAVA